MPELPDITIYLDALKRRVEGQRLNQLRILSPFIVRTATPPVDVLVGRSVIGLRRLGKQIVFGFDGDLWLVLHLMVGGRLHWRESRAPLNRKQGLMAFEFIHGSLVLTEGGTKRRASLHLVSGEAALREFDQHGLEIAESSAQAFAQALTLRNHTLKRALTDPHLFSGIGNAYSDEILHRARLSPVALSQSLSGVEIDRLHAAAVETMSHWIQTLREQTGDNFPENVTAFREGMAVHGKFGKLCPVCGSKVQRIRRADTEVNYCPQCQTGGKLLADRSLSLLLKKDWPSTPEELERLRSPGSYQEF